jgi:hypothetical protein
MSRYNPIITEVVALLEEQAQPLTLRELSLALGIAAADIRAQVRAFDVEQGADRTGLVPEIMIEPADLDNPEAPSDDDLVILRGDFGREVLGIERFGAAVLAPLYRAAAELAVREPGNRVLAQAAEVLRMELLAGVRPASRFRADAIAVLSTAITSQLKVRIRYSRAWHPGVITREIEPLALVETGRGLEVDAGPVHPDGSIRTYLVSRISQAEALAEHFDPPVDITATVESHRSPQTVSGTVRVDRAWVIRRLAEEFRVTGRLGHQLRFEADLLPPVAWRAGLATIVAGRGTRFDSQAHQQQAEELARELWAHHNLDLA